MVNEKCSVTYLDVNWTNTTGELMALKDIGKVNSRTKFLARVAKFLDTETMETSDTVPL